MLAEERPRVSTFQLWVTPADGSEAPRRIAAAHMLPHATWNPAGTHVAYNTWPGQDGKGPVGLYIVDVRTGEQHEIELPEGLMAGRITQWSPDGKWIGVIRGSGSYELWVAENVPDDRTNSR